MIDLISLLGQNGYEIIEDSLGGGHIAYNIPVIASAILVILSWKYILTWITILIKAGLGVGKID